MPRWSMRGDKLYYVAPPGRLVEVEVSTTPQVTLGTPRAIPLPPSVTVRPHRLSVDVARDGRLLVVQTLGGGQSSPLLTIVQNWVEEFKKP